MEDEDQDRLKVQAPVSGIYFLVLDRSIINIYHIIYYYIIKIRLKCRHCAKWLHQMVEIFLDFSINSFT